jgi:hypothetical protein
MSGFPCARDGTRHHYNSSEYQLEDDMDNAMNELWRAQQDAAKRATEGWLELLQPGAKRAPQAPEPVTADSPARLPDTGSTAEDTPDDATDGEIVLQDSAPEPAVLEALQAIRAIQNLGDGQRDFAEHMTHWADLQRDLADSMTAWAKQQREYADALDRLLAPFSHRS